MPKATTFEIALPAMFLLATIGLIAADAQAPKSSLPEGTKAITVELSKGQELPKGAIPGKSVDIIGEIVEPTKTGIALLHVELLAVDSVPLGEDRNDAAGPRLVTVRLTQAQAEVLALMKKHVTKLWIKVPERQEK
jgi:Flp pilus assembly protein CpaB